MGGERAGMSLAYADPEKSCVSLPSSGDGRTESRVFSPKNNNQTLFLLLRFSLSVVLRSSSLGSHTKTVCLSLRYVPPLPSSPLPSVFRIRLFRQCCRIDEWDVVYVVSILFPLCYCLLLYIYFCGSKCSVSSPYCYTASP